MRDISNKQITLRSAKGIGIVFCSGPTIELIRNDQLPKGNLFEVARAAGFLGAKATPQLLPHCHPVNIDGMNISFGFLEKEKHEKLLDTEALGRTGIVIIAEAKSIGRTGIEMEVLTAVSVAALEIYDMLKPVDTSLEISHIRLLEKKGGKSDRKAAMADKPLCAVLVCSDSAALGKRKDESGQLLKTMLEVAGADVRHLQIVPDEKDQIQQSILQWVKEEIQFIFTTGGTGLGPRDNTPEAIEEIIERKAEGITEAMRGHGQMRTPLAMLSRSVAGSIGKTLIVSLPGSTKGVKESLEAILPAVFHARVILEGECH
jgi:cyclic pyranopterin monophosphate synthase